MREEALKDGLRGHTHPSIGGGHLAGEVETALQQLSADEQQILRLRFGIGGRKRSLMEVGTSFGLSPRRVQQIESRALGSLRSHAIREAAARASGAAAGRARPDVGLVLLRRFS